MTGNFGVCIVVVVPLRAALVEVVKVMVSKSPLIWDITLIVW
jgi:hypothetical protein